MRVAKVVGTVTLSRAHANLRQPRLRLVHPLETPDEIRSGTPAQDADLVCAFDTWGAAEGMLVALAEGPEAANPFRPEIFPIDASIAVLLDAIDF